MSTPIDAAEICRISSPTSVSVAPDGDRVAFTALEWDQSQDERHTALYVVPSDGSKAPHRLARVAAVGQPKWSPDGSMLGFVSTREDDIDRRIGIADDDEDDEDEESDPESQVWAFDLERGGDAIQLTDREWGVRAFDWGPRGERIVISARDPTEEQATYLEEREDDGPIEIGRLQHKIDGVGFTDDVTTYLFVVDIESDETTRLDATAGAGAFEPLHGMEPTWHPTDDTIAYINTEVDNPDDTVARDIYLVDVERDESEQLTDLGCTIASPSWSPSGDHLVLSGRDAVNWYLPSNVFVVDVEDETVTTVSEGLEATVSWFGFPRFVDEQTIIAGMGDHGWTRFYRFATDGSSVEALDLGVADGTASLRNHDIAGGTLAVIRSDPTEGIDVFASEASIDESTTLTRLTELNRSFIEERPQPKFTRLTSPGDDAEIESMVYYPDSFDPDNPDPHPVIIWTHGGPMSYDDPEFRFHFPYFTSRGYLIVKPNYRGSTSYGAEFAEILKSEWGSVEVDDVLAVADDLVNRGWADETRQFATGFSYGGILTGFLITQSDRFAAAAAEHGIYDLRSEFGTSDSHVWVGNEFGLPWEDPENFDTSSSLLDVGGVDTPTLVTAGAQDWRCPPTQSEQFYVSLKKQGVDAKLVVYPEENHDVSSPERAIHRFEELADWFERYDPATE